MAMIISFLGEEEISAVERVLRSGMLSHREQMLKHSSPLLLIKLTSTENSACGNGGDELKISE